MIRRIREVLRLQTKPGPALVYLAAFALDRAVQGIAGIKLNAWLSRIDFQCASAFRLFYARRQRQPGTAFVQHPVMVVASAEFQLLVILVDARANGRAF